MRGHDLFRATAVVAALLCYATILVGGTVMASDSGLGCPNWPACYANGSFLPTVTGAAAIEWTHRVVAFFLSSCVLLLALFGVVYERSRPVLQRLALLSLGLVLSEAGLGGWVVRSELSTELVLVHLAIATALFGLLLLLLFLANLREMPRRWIEWARRATEERAADPAEPVADPVPAPGSVVRAGTAHQR